MVSKEQESANFSNKSSENSESSVFVTLWAILSLGPLTAAKWTVLAMCHWKLISRNTGWVGPIDYNSPNAGIMGKSTMINNQPQDFNCFIKTKFLHVYLWEQT